MPAPTQSDRVGAIKERFRRVVKAFGVKVERQGCDARGDIQATLSAFQTDRIERD
ncbi:MAG: hypothetical protein AAGF59_05095 [Pseudomonadota bacterium]